jgi:hypothetical protein
MGILNFKFRRGAYSPTAGLPFDDVELESRLVWIWGSPRSGSTWLLEMLCDPLAPDWRDPLGFTRPSEWSGTVAALPLDEFMISSHLVPHRGEVVDVLGEPYPATLNGLFGRRSNYAFADEFADVWRPEARRMTLVRVNALIDRVRAAGLPLQLDLPFVVIKEVNGSHAADIVMSLFPRSRMIFLLRDGRDVLDSILDASRAGGWRTSLGHVEEAPDTDARRLDLVRESAREWVARINVCQRAYEAHDPALRRWIRYEDLLADTGGALRDLAGWLGLPWDEEWIQSVAERHSFAAVPEHLKGPGRVRRSATPGRWRQALSQEERELAERIMGSRLTELGYA